MELERAKQLLSQFDFMLPSVQPTNIDDYVMSVREFNNWSSKYNMMMMRSRYKNIVNLIQVEVFRTEYDNLCESKASKDGDNN